MSHINSKRGVFILFEGVDRCGKSTQSSLLTSYLSVKKQAELIKYPDRTSVIGQLINSYLSSTSEMSDQTIHLLFSANRWEGALTIESKLLSGCHLVCDRYAYSGVAFTGAKGLDLNWCKSCDVGLPAPDAVIFLDISVEDAAARGDYGNERYEKMEFQSKVREQFSELKREDEGHIPWHVIDARLSIEEIQHSIQDIADHVIEDCENKQIKKLWSAK